jgi:hypothetical protein
LPWLAPLALGAEAVIEPVITPDGVAMDEAH